MSNIKLAVKTSDTPICGVSRRDTGSEKLKLGRLDIWRDWAWVPECIEAMLLMLQKNQPQDYVITMGTAITLEGFVKTAFEQAGLTRKDPVAQDSNLSQHTDLAIGRSHPSTVHQMLAWKASTQRVKVVKKMYHSLQ